MKAHLNSSILATLLGVVFTAELHAQTTTFTYQGRLADGGQPANGLFDMRFQLFATSNTVAGSAVGGALTNLSVPASNGLFTVTLDFGTGIFTGADRWLEIGVRPAGTGSFEMLTPRQPITSAPYAIHAAQAAGLQNGAASVSNGTVTFDPASGPPFNVGSSTKVPNLNADLLDGLDSSAFVHTSGDTMTGTLEVNGPGGTATLSDTGAFFGNDITVSGSASSALGIGVNGSSSGASGYGVFAQATGENGAGLYATANTGADARAIHGQSTSGLAGLFQGGVRVEYASPFSKPQLELSDPSDSGFSRLRLQTGTRSFWDIAVGTGVNATNTLRFYNNGSGDVMRLSAAGMVLNTGVPLMLSSELTGSGDTKDLIFIKGSGVTARIGVRNSPFDGIVTRARIHQWSDQNDQQMMTLGRNIQNLPVLNVGNGIVSCGSVLETSDRNLKENFAAVEAQETLEKALSLELSTWQFKDDSTARHMGPMAQDFYAAFGLGPDERHIATRDLAAVALAATQGLNEKLTEELKRKEAEITKLKARMDRLERLVNAVKGDAQ